MRYMGGKQRIAKELSLFIYENYLEGNNKPFIDLMCGSCNVLTNICRLQRERERAIVD